MFDRGFSNLIASYGLLTQKQLRKVDLNNRADDFAEFKLPDVDGFDELKLLQKVHEDSGKAIFKGDVDSVDPKALSMLQKKLVIKYRLLPVKELKEKVIVCAFDPLAKNNLQDCMSMLGKPIEMQVCSISVWEKLFAGVKISIQELVESVRELDPLEDSMEDEVSSEDANTSDVVSIVNRILAESYYKGASDIHVETYEKKFRVRYRVDGSLIEAASPPRSMAAAIISRFKILSKLDIAERRRPQDGRMKLIMGTKQIDYRVSCLPTLFGEKVVMRLLDSSNLQLDMTKLGFMQKQLDIFQDSIKRPFGMCLVTGPTGSGKTTTLYSALSELNKPNTNISTAEDPCEFNLEGINQVNVKKDIGLTFAAALKSFLRQDPDIIMVGEIRDQEVGEMAVEAALTGHFVFSTLHTNDAASTITRLINLGIEPFLVVTALTVVIAQRLCKRICTHCKAEAFGHEKELLSLGVSPRSINKVKVYKGEGCAHCNHTGYKGRVAIHEVLPVSPAIRDLILDDAPTEHIKKRAVFEGMRTLRMSALVKVTQGITTLEEAVMNSASDNF